MNHTIFELRGGNLRPEIAKDSACLSLLTCGRESGVDEWLPWSWDGWRKGVRSMFAGTSKDQVSLDYIFEHSSLTLHLNGLLLGLPFLTQRFGSLATSFPAELNS